MKRNIYYHEKNIFLRENNLKKRPESMNKGRREYGKRQLKMK